MQTPDDPRSWRDVAREAEDKLTDLRVDYEHARQSAEHWKDAWSNLRQQLDHVNKEFAGLELLREKWEKEAHRLQAILDSCGCERKQRQHVRTIATMWPQMPEPRMERHEEGP